jgi:hypothetical protein
VALDGFSIAGSSSISDCSVSSDGSDKLYGSASSLPTSSSSSESMSLCSLNDELSLAGKKDIKH